MVWCHKPELVMPVCGVQKSQIERSAFKYWDKAVTERLVEWARFSELWFLVRGDGSISVRASEISKYCT